MEMKDMIETNRTMDRMEHPAPRASCDTLSTTAPEAQCNLQMCIPTVKQETVECIDEEEPPCSDDMSTYKALQSSDYVNYYDSKFCVLEELKKEFPEDECPQSDCSMNSKIVTGDKELLNVIEKQTVQHNNIEEEGLPLSINEQNVNKKYRVTIKGERLEEQDILDNTDATSIHYDVLVTPKEVQCKLCGRIFINSFKLLKHNNGHLKVELNTSRDYEINNLHQCQYCDKGFNNHDNMLSHVGDVHSEKIPKCAKQFKNVEERNVPLLDKLKKSTKQVTRINLKCMICNVDFENRYKLYKHVKLCRTGKEDGKMGYKCDSCELVYVSELALELHKKRTHCDYGCMFLCSCGKQFRTPLHLYDHKREQHDDNVEDNNEAKFQCDSCQKVFNAKNYILSHIRNVHCIYDKAFQCLCGKQFRTPMQLTSHKRLQHYDTSEVKCDSCQKVFNSKKNLLLHIKNVHVICDKLFECLCGRQFRTPYQLYDHRSMHHRGKVKDTNKYNFQCDTCQKVFNRKRYLVRHIKNTHVIYDKVFECLCGKQYRTPDRLYNHRSTQHRGKVKDTNEYNFQCDTCQKVFNSKNKLLRHIKNAHIIYDKVFECLCGKQFRTPYRLYNHRSRHHRDKVKDTNKYNVQCDTCQKVFNSKKNIVRHIKNTHVIYDKVFECLCGRQYRTPDQLNKHKWAQHCGKVKDTNEYNFQCDTCQKVFNSKNKLLRHIKNAHIIYDKVFECLCGKQFRTPYRLYNHRSKHHRDKVKDTNKYNVQCDTCQKVFNSKTKIVAHTKNVHVIYDQVFECFCGKQFRTPNQLSNHRSVFHSGNVKR